MSKHIPRILCLCHNKEEHNKDSHNGDNHNKDDRNKDDHHKDDRNKDDRNKDNCKFAREEIFKGRVLPPPSRDIFVLHALYLFPEFNEASQTLLTVTAIL